MTLLDIDISFYNIIDWHFTLQYNGLAHNHNNSHHITSHCIITTHYIIATLELGYLMTGNLLYI